MKKTLQICAALAGFAATASMVGAQAQPGSAPAQNDPRLAPQARKGSAETSLIGISLYDTGLKVINKYGSPDSIEPISIATEGAEQGGGGGRGGPGGGGGGGSTGGGGMSPQAGNQPQYNPGGSLPLMIAIDEDDVMPGFGGDPFMLRQNSASATPAVAPDAGGGGRGGDTGRGGRGGGGASAPTGGRGGGGGGGATERVTVTRWVYNRGAHRYGFILDKFNRVIQIEAVGMPTKSVGTKRGVMLGCPFSQLIKLYGAPDGYEISGDNLVVRYLVLDRVAFKLQRLKAGEKQKVTGIVVAAGKT